MIPLAVPYEFDLVDLLAYLLLGESSNWICRVKFV